MSQQEAVTNGGVEKIYLNEKEAAVRYGLSVHWFRRARWDQQGPDYIKLQSRCLYPIASTDAYFASKLVTPTSGKTITRQKGGPGRGHTGKMEP